LEVSGAVRQLVDVRRLKVNCEADVHVKPYVSRFLCS